MTDGAQIEIDGSFGEGGGQIVRSSISLSLVTGKSFRVYNIRANRPKPGLRPQHLSAVQAALKISGSKAQGAEIGSRELWFDPGPVRPGNFRIDIGTAGSTGLVFQTLLPALLGLDQTSSLEIRGGTHNPKSPCFDYLQETFLPVLSGMGVMVEKQLQRHGFYPRGGGEVKFIIQPWKDRSKVLEMAGPVEWQGPSVEIILAGLEQHIAERERDELVMRLMISPEQIKINFLASDQGPGNVVLLRFFSGRRTEMFANFGERGKRAETVAHELAREAKNFARSRAQLDSHLADQILIYLALSGGGRFTTNYLSSHFHTNLEIIKRFIDLEAEIKAPAPDLSLVQINPKRVS